MNRRDRRRQISTIAQRPDVGQRFAADMKVATGLHKQNRLKDAAALYRKITKAYEDLPEVRVAWSNLGAALQMDGKLEEAVAALKKARSLAPDHPPPHHNLGMALLALGKREEGLESLSRAIELEPRFRDAWVGFVNACRESGEIGRIEDLCRTILARQPDQLEAMLTLGDVMRSQGRFAEAEDQYRSAIALDPRRIEPQISLAGLMAAIGDPAAGVRQLLPIVKEIPNAGPVRSALLELLVQVRVAAPEDALAMAEEWKASTPGDEAVSKIVESFRANGKADTVGEAPAQPAGSPTG